MNLDLAKYFFPDSILDYFDIVSNKLKGVKVHFYLEEKNN